MDIFVFSKILDIYMSDRIAITQEDIKEIVDTATKQEEENNERR